MTGGDVREMIVVFDEAEEFRARYIQGLLFNPKWQDTQSPFAKALQNARLQDELRPVFVATAPILQLLGESESPLRNKMREMLNRQKLNDEPEPNFEYADLITHLRNFFSKNSNLMKELLGFACVLKDVDFSNLSVLEAIVVVVFVFDCITVLNAVAECPQDEEDDTR